MLEYLALGMVLEQDLTGYDVKKKIERGIGVFYKASFGSLYPALKKLTDRNRLSALSKPQGGRQKIYYRITEEGKREFLDWLSTPINLLEGSASHLAKVYFFDKLPVEIRERQLLSYEINNQNYLQKLKDLEEEFDKLQNKDCFYYKLSTLYYGIRITESAIAWCRHIRLHKPLPDLLESE